MPSQNIKNLPGTWKTSSTDYDVEVKIDEKTIIVTRGKNTDTWTYSSDQLITITYGGNGLQKNSFGGNDKPFFFFDKDTLLLTLPDSTLWLLKRQK
jgi:hypothetical protein